MGEPLVDASGLTAGGFAPDSSYVPPRGVESTRAREAPEKRLSVEIEQQIRRLRKANYSWLRRLLIAGSAAMFVLAAIALLAPRGTLIAGLCIVVIGMLMLIAGYGAGAYGAFCEDSLYGLLYLIFPLYTAYYMVTRWEDLWAWFACSTAGVVLIVIGTFLVELSGFGT